MKIELVFDDWRVRKSWRSIYSTERGVELSSGDLHSGSTFRAEIELDAENEADLREAIANGAVPVFWVELTAREGKEKR